MKEVLRKVLEENGFSKSESLVYLELLIIGETRSGELIKKTGLQSSVVHNALNTLTEKGFVTHILKGKVKHYRALDPKLISEEIKVKYELFNQHLPEFNVFKDQRKDAIEIEVYEGLKGLFSAHMKLIENGKDKKCKYFATLDMSEECREFFRKMDKDRKYRKMKVRGIASDYMKKGLKDYQDSKIKFVNSMIPPPMNICGDKVLLYLLNDKPKGILIKSAEIAKQYHNLWDSLWNN